MPQSWEAQGGYSRLKTQVDQVLILQAHGSLEPLAGWQKRRGACDPSSTSHHHQGFQGPHQGARAITKREGLATLRHRCKAKRLAGEG